MNRKARLVTAVMVFLGMLSVLALPVVNALPGYITLDDDTIECYQTVWIRINFDTPGADGLLVWCNLTDSHGNVYHLGSMELNSTGAGNYSYAPDCTGGTWTVNVTYPGYDDGGEPIYVELTFTMQSSTSCVTQSLNEWVPTFFYIFLVLVLICLLLIMVSKVTNRAGGKKKD